MAASAGVVDRALHAWRQQLSTVGGPSPLLHFEDSPRTRVELSSTHPGGLPSSSRASRRCCRTSSATRSRSAVRKRAADRITTKGIELRTVRGIDAVHLAIGLAQWTHRRVRTSAPRSCSGRSPSAATAATSRSSCAAPPPRTRARPRPARAVQIVLDPDAFVALAVSDGVFKPQPVIDRLRSSPRTSNGSRSSRARSSPRSPTSATPCSPTPPSSTIRPRRRRRQRDGAVGLVRRQLHARRRAVRQDDRPPATDTLLLDADAEQENVIAQIGAGNSLVVKTLPGTGGTQTIVNAIGVLASQHKRVLVVSPRRSTLEGIRHRLTKVGLPGRARHRRPCAATSSRRSRATRRRPSRRSARSTTRSSGCVGCSSTTAPRCRRRTPISGSRSRCARSLSKLSHAAVPSGYHCAGSTARRSSGSRRAARARRRRSKARPPSASSATALATRPGTARRSTRPRKPHARPRARQAPAPQGPPAAARARVRPHRADADAAVRVHRRARHLPATPRATSARRSTSFQPDVFDRSLADLIVATCPREGLGRECRRRAAVGSRHWPRSTCAPACARARHERRPPSHPAAAHPVAALCRDRRAARGPARHRRRRAGVPDGRREARAGSTSRSASPTPRTGSDASRSRVSSARSPSSPPSPRSSTTSRSAPRSSPACASRVSTSSSSTCPSGTCPTDAPRRRARARLVAVGARTRARPRTAVCSARTRASLERLESDFRLVDEAHASASGQLLASLLADTWKIGLVDHATEGMALRSLLKRDRPLRATELEQAAPTLSRVLAPVWLVSPYEVPRIPESASFDAVFLVDAGATLLAENVDAIRRARQVVAFGDPVTQTSVSLRDPSDGSGDGPRAARRHRRAAP